ncbi:hypothetical protein [Nocardioides bruguierae]|uniref:hypothetical protein n=1 Tax=Nocardioides bruguierae TaxID=2945102 RepID=UPI0020210105|nr:hypothetical protein [Nocardioides bruguierae]MCL8026342.1 hypothetical protein [Nocardioides bruguierae]
MTTQPTTGLPDTAVVCHRLNGHVAHDTTAGRCPGRPHQAALALADVHTRADEARALLHPTPDPKQDQSVHDHPLAALGGRHRAPVRVDTASTPITHAPSHCAGRNGEHCLHAHPDDPPGLEPPGFWGATRTADA